MAAGEDEYPDRSEEGMSHQPSSTLDLPSCSNFARFVVRSASAMLAEAFTLLIGVFVAALLFADARDARRVAFACKTAASLCFVLLAASLQILGRGAFGVLVFGGLVMAFGGDVALAVPGGGAFLVGLGLFLVGHLAYIGAFAAVVPPGGWLSAVSAAPVIVTLLAYAALSPKLGKMRGAVIAYMVAITVMVVAAIAARRAGHPHGDALLCGALLFYVSDLSVARDRFVARAFVNRAWGLPVYYAAQVLMAWAAR
jgi:uncharacterized membrane protein YhhN